MTQMSFKSFHEPVAQIRHRFGQNGVYNELSGRKKSMKWEFAAQMRGQNMKRFESEPIHFELTCFCSIPKSKSKKKLADRPKMTKPDLDNYIKFYSDVLSGIAFKDDNQICLISAKKIYSEIGGVEIKISPIEET